MVKKLFTIIFGLTLACGASAQLTTIDPNDVNFWVGSGSNSTVVAIGWDDDDASYTPTVVIWGVHWNGNIHLLDALDSIATYDSRFTYTFSGGMVNQIDYNDPVAGIHLSPSAEYNCNSYGGAYASTYLTTTHLRISESTCSNYNFTGVSNIIYATNPNATDATIAAADILYWVGEGSDSAIFVISDGVNTRAWGYLFDEDDEPTATDMAIDIDAADPRLAYTITDWTTYDMGFVYKEFPMAIAIGDTRFKVNGVLADEDDELSDIDIEDGMVVIVSSESAATWTTPIVPATVKHMPENSTIDADDILYWVGEGVNEAVVVVNWGVPDTALAWGLRFTDATTIGNAIDSIAAADPRVSTDASHSTINYNDGNVNLSFQPAPASYMQFIMNDNSNVNVNTQLTDGAQLKIGESAYGVGYDSTEYMGMWYPMGVVWNTEIHPVSIPTPEPPAVEDAAIEPEDVLFWVGHGDNQVVMAINWADSALAWGYRFSTDSVLVGDMVNDIATVDPRFSFEGSTSYISDLLYYDSTMSDTLRLTPHDPMDYSVYFNLSVNHVASMLGAGQRKVVNGDFVKFADTYVAVKVDSTWVPEWGGYWDYTYAWPMTIHPVTVPDTTGGDPGSHTEHGPFCGAVGTEGCTAIAADSSAIVAWATNVVVTRGPRNISVPGSTPASHGTDSNAIGMATMDNTFDCVSLGDGGTALVTFAHPIRNGEGPDFAVFENGFGDVNLELAFVEVSSDGERFVRFPATSLTQTETEIDNFGTIDPTNINNLAGKFRIGYGTPFDLNELADSTGINVDSIVYVRIVDVVGSIDPQYGTYDAYGHIINDPWPTPFDASGFDLSGVGVINERIDSNEVATDATIDQADIIFWAGKGQNKAVIAVNWAAPDTCLAWGVKWNGTATVKDLMDTIAAYDSRFTYTANGGMLSDIVYSVDNLTLQLTTESSSPWGNYWMYNVNGTMAMSYFNALEVQNGDFVKWGDPNSGTSIGTDEWGSDILVWTTTVTPVTVPPTGGIESVTDALQNLWPNPATDHVNVTLAQAAQAELFDQTGRRMGCYTLNEGNNTLDFSHLVAGVYILRVGESHVKIIKR